jgi:hypothetical protein
MGSGKLTIERIDDIEEAIRMGATRELAAKYAGITRSCLQKWLRDGKLGKHPLKEDLVKRIRRAEGYAAMQWLKRIEQAAEEGTWQAAAWKLERLYPESYGRSVPRVIIVNNSSNNADPPIDVSEFARRSPREQDDALRKIQGWEQ